MKSAGTHVFSCAEGHTIPHVCVTDGGGYFLSKLTHNKVLKCMWEFEIKFQYRNKAQIQHMFLKVEAKLSWGRYVLVAVALAGFGWWFWRSSAAFVQTGWSERGALLLNARGPGCPTQTCCTEQFQPVGPHSQ